MAYAVQNKFPSTFVISPGFPFHSSIWDVSPLFQGIRVRLLEDAIHDSGSANCFSLTEAKNSSNVRCSSISVKQHQTLSHRTGEVNLHPHPPPRLGSPRSVWGCLGFFFPVPENKSIQTIHSYIPPCQTHSETQWDEEEPSLGKVLVAFNTPATDTLRDRTPVITTTQSVFHRGNPTALATGTW